MKCCLFSLFLAILVAAVTSGGLLGKPIPSFAVSNILNISDREDQAFKIQMRACHAMRMYFER